MVNISPVSFQSTKKIGNQKAKITEQKPITNPAKSSKVDPLKVQLLALAMLGASTLSSCVYNDTLDELEEIINTEQVMPKDPAVMSRADSMAKTIGLLDADERLIDVPTLSFSDQNNYRYYYQPVGGGIDDLKVDHFKLNPDYTGNKYRVNLSKEHDNGIRYVKTNEKNDTIDNKVYTIKNDTIMEHDSMNNKTAKIYKSGEGSFVRESSDGDIVLFNNIGKNESMPEPIEFGDPVVDDWKKDNNNMDV